MESLKLQACPRSFLGGRVNGSITSTANPLVPDAAADWASVCEGNLHLTSTYPSPSTSP
jgi:hypothetical protein